MISVSVIIPVYNSEEYIARAIESVLAQTITQIEIICVDDGSTDRSAEIIKRYQNTDSRIIYVYQKNNGPGAARNTGMSKASGEYIAFLDGDDEYPNKFVLELLYGKAKSHNVYICGGSVCGSWNATLNDLTQFTEGIHHFIDYQNDFMFWRYIYQRKFLEDENLKFPAYRDYEDPVFLLAVMDKAQVFYAVSEYVYKKNEGHLTVGKKSGIQLEHRLLGIEANMILAIEKNYSIIYFRNIVAFCNQYGRIVELIRKNESDTNLFDQLYRIVSLVKIRKIPLEYQKKCIGRLRVILANALYKNHNHFFFWLFAFLKTEMLYVLLRINEVVTK